ncbi:MAG: nucleoside phosphorylase [Clostridiales bacterium]|nr:nucleoside phosphorylase [Clostridiales bacterium]
MEEKKQYHLHTTSADVAPYVLLPGDPHRVPLVAKLWDEARFVADNREHVTYTGTYKGMPITCTSTGMGCPSTAIAVEELARCGATTMMRMGTTAGIASNVHPGDLVIFDSACRFEGTTKCYVPPEYPAVSHHEIVAAAIQTAERLGRTFHVGTSRCIDALYSNRPDPNCSFGGYHPHAWDHFLSDLRQMNVIAGEMESAAVMVLTRLFGLRGGAICMCVASLTQDFDRGGQLDVSSIPYGGDRIEQLNRIALDTMYQIYRNDQAKASGTK